MRAADDLRNARLQVGMLTRHKPKIRIRRGQPDRCLGSKHPRGPKPQWVRRQTVREFKAKPPDGSASGDERAKG